MTDILAEICATTAAEVARRKTAVSLSELDRRAATQTAPRGFEAALRRSAVAGFGLIAEIKRASPSKGLIRADFDPPVHARAYAAGGATCLSVLTDAPYFQGHDDYLVAARGACELPVIRKDFMVDPWQCAEARAIGADAILIIVSALSDGQMAEIEAAALERGMDVLVEVHDEAEMERAARLRSRLIGVNNRDLRRFVTDLATTERLAPLAPDGALLVGESGINQHADLERLAAAGVRCFLVGESLMRQTDIATATRALLGTVANGG
ncbi:MAG TPA: indole-3-glycerol phosphate synthase TrpC [Novosphingobium sp.]